MRQRVKNREDYTIWTATKKAYPLTKKRICFFVLGNELQGAVLTLKYRSELIIVTLVENLAILLFPPLQKPLQQVTNKLQRMILQPFHPFFTVLVMISSCNASLRKTK